MNRLAAIAAGAALLVSTGCVHDDWSVRRALGWEEVKTPRPPKLPPAQIATAERVETLGRKIIAQNTFTGIEPLFHTVGVKESVLFHRGTEELYISEGLVAKCKTDEELAALLCAELGQMAAEKRAAKAVGRDVDPIADVGHGGGPLFPGGTAYDAGRQAELGFHEQKHPRGAGANHLEAADAARLSRDLLSGAGFDPASLDRVEPLLKQSDRGVTLRKQFGGAAPLPKWDK
jgi:hypothetical protein